MTSASVQEIQARLDGWREQGLDRRDPLRFHLIAAMARRSAGRGERVRRLLDGRLAELVRAFEAAAADPAAGAAATAQAKPGAQAAPASEAGRMQAPGGAQVQRPHDADAASLASLPARLAEGRRAAGAHDAYPELEMLDHFRRMGARMRVERRARESLAQAPGNAGPLNSARLAHRAMALMHAQSPAYLRRFVDYLDTLAWLETPAETPRPRAARKA